MKIQTLIAAVALALSGAAFAQTATPTPTPKDPLATPKIDKALVNDQKRIDAGVKSGQLTSQEAAKLEADKEKIQANKTAAKADGKVTKQERRQLQREQKGLSKEIHEKKHNRRTAN